MKASKYNIYIQEQGRFYVYNQLSSALTEFDEELFETLRSKKIDMLTDDTRKELKESNFLCDTDLIT